MAKQKEIYELAGVSNESVKGATGKGWAYWIHYLARKNADSLVQRELVKLLPATVASPWWRQKIALGFREAKGKRITGQTAASGFQIGVRRALPLTKDAAWDFLISPEAMKIWLGKAIAPDDTKPRTVKKGLRAELVVFTPGSHLRLRWHPDKWISPSTLQVRVVAGAKSSTLSFHHDGLPDEAAREEMKAHWSAVLGKLAGQLSKNLT
ncbi:SRPBCC domain-containing protein [Chryseolinea lacunae]|uniref:Activator of Hsp90 ATPase homologue 1/2-like C-terminal domain-containing protein n=1 Tax=Chryseolinea lacunae TaxID=2801331 RepID=A0ABS1KU45_9BACT|nr:SRPBCC domain-containing protein [Chryseolinea lacunae]MBL0742950.1 hypothetical protein [Chryseolinea lacunae]